MFGSGSKRAATWTVAVGLFGSGSSGAAVFLAGELGRRPGSAPAPRSHVAGERFEEVFDGGAAARLLGAPV